MKQPAVHSIVSLVVVCFLSEAAIPSLGPTTKLKKCPDEYYGYNCRQHCMCADRSECDVTPRCSGGCAEGWEGPTCQSQNTAFQMPTKIRTRDPTVTTRSRVAVDGNSSTCVTSDPNNPGWLRVDLLQTVSVYYLTLVTDSSTSPRSWQVYVTEFSDFYWATPCATVRSSSQHVHMACDSPTRGQYLTVLNTRGPVTVCELQAHVCADFTFGAGCVGTCQCADVSEVCHPITGRCTTGCRPGFSGRNCQQHCNMTYGSNCVTPCGQCRWGEACHPVSGACPSSCRPGWTGQNCNKTCTEGLYGQDCGHRCGACEDGVACAPDTGLCPDRCMPGRHGPRCDRACQEGMYGPSCQFQCGHCYTGSTCNVTTGICHRGCGSGWEGLFCTQECLPHKYGMNCLGECPQCMTSCDSVTGQCDVNGCRAGKIGLFCNEDCQEGQYGINCSHTCGQCLDKERSCDSSSGQCPGNLCLPGWTGPTCSVKCDARWYGVNCSQSCGHCESSDVCDHVTGKCPRGCGDGYYGELCQTLTIFLDTTSETSVALTASILTIALLVVAIVCVCLALKWRRDHHVDIDKPTAL